MTVRSPTTTLALRKHSDTVQGVAAAIGETDKAATYAGCFYPASATLICFAVETNGLLGKQAEKLLLDMATHKASLETAPLAVGPGEAGMKGKYVARMRQTMSVGLQTALSNRELGFAQLQRQHGGQSVSPIERLWDAAAGG